MMNIWSQAIQTYAGNCRILENKIWQGRQDDNCSVLLSQGDIVNIVLYQPVSKTFLNIFADSQKLLRGLR